MTSLSNFQGVFGRVPLVGVALREQILRTPEFVPTSETDWKLDLIVVGDGEVIQKPAE